MTEDEIAYRVIDEAKKFNRGVIDVAQFKQVLANASSELWKCQKRRYSQSADPVTQDGSSPPSR